MKRLAIGVFVVFILLLLGFVISYFVLSRDTETTVGATGAAVASRATASADRADRAASRATGSAAHPAVPTATPEPDAIVRLDCADCAAGGMPIFLYAEPGISRVVGRIRHGTQAVIVEREIVDGTLFYRVRVGDVTGWLNSSLVKK